MKKLLAAIAIAFALGIPSAPVPLAAPTPPKLQQPNGNPSTKVWVNTESGVYHCPGTRWYGTTKRGEFMTQKQAQAKGYRPAYGSVCA
jgi:hypothetical protein